MKPAPFDYIAPDSLEQAIEILARYGDEAKPLAGGQSLVPAMNFRLARPAVLVDLGRIPDLDYVRESKDRETRDEVRVGAMTRLSTLERSPVMQEAVPLVTGALPHVAHAQIRNRGTLGGNIAHGDPASELPAVLLALRGRLRLVGPKGERWVSVDDFYRGLFDTACCDDELLVEIAWPKVSGISGWGFHEMARRHGDYGLVGVAAHVELGADGRCTSCRMGYLSVGDGPMLAESVSQALEGIDFGAEVLDQAIDDAARVASQDDIEPPADLHASTAYRRHLAWVLGRRALRDAARRALRSIP